MILKGKYCEARVFTDNIEQKASEQVIELLNQPFVKGEKICIMPDVHAGKGCTIGTTMTYSNAIVPNLVGVDIGCGMLTVPLGNIGIDFEKFDKVVRQGVPSGREIHKTEIDYFDFSNIIAPLNNIERLRRSMGTLGGGEMIASISVNSR